MFNGMDTLTALIFGIIAGIIATLLFRNNKHKNYRRLASFISFLIVFFITKNWVYPYYEAATFESHIKQQNELFRTIAEKFPDDFNHYIAQMKKIIVAGKKEKEITYSNSLVNAVMAKTLPYASPKMVYKFIQTTNAYENKLYAINPLLVLAIEFPERLPKGPLRKLIDEIPEGTIKEKSKATIDLILASTDNKKPFVLSDEEINDVKQDIQEIVLYLNKKYGNEIVTDTFENSNAPFINPTKSSEVVLDFYNQLLAKGEERGGAILKVIFSPKN